MTQVSFDGDLNRTCCFTGHRNLPSGFDRQLIFDSVIAAAEQGIDTFLCGMATGFDAECFDAVMELKNEKSLTLIACIPCLDQDKFFNKQEKENYLERLKTCDGKVFITDEPYRPGCMQRRNRYMVDRSGLIIAFLTADTGGTKMTVDYAVKKGRRIINLAK